MLNIFMPGVGMRLGAAPVGVGCDPPNVADGVEEVEAEAYADVGPFMESFDTVTSPVGLILTK